MKKHTILILLCFVFLTIEVNPLDLDVQNLKGLKFVRLQCEFNGIDYYKGYQDMKSQKLEEFNLVNVTEKLSEAEIPISKKDIRALYSQLEKQFKKSGLEIVKMGRGGKKGGFAGSTILPMISINSEIIKATEESFHILIYLTVSKWISTWVNNQTVNSHVIIWWQKKMLTVSNEELFKTISIEAKALSDELIMQLKNIGSDEEEEENEKN